MGRRGARRVPAPDGLGRVISSPMTCRRDVSFTSRACRTGTRPPRSAAPKRAVRRAEAFAGDASTAAGIDVDADHCVLVDVLAATRTCSARAPTLVNDRACAVPAERSQGTLACAEVAFDSRAVGTTSGRHRDAHRAQVVEGDVLDRRDDDRFRAPLGVMPTQRADAGLGSCRSGRRCSGWNRPGGSGWCGFGSRRRAVRYPPVVDFSWRAARSSALGASSANASWSDAVRTRARLRSARSSSRNAESSAACFS